MVARGGCCCARLTRRFFKACAITRFRNQFARGQKTIGSHCNPLFDVVLFKVGPTWGRKMVNGYMASCGITAGDKRVGRALSVVSPLYQAQRNSNTARQTNPFPYHADYFGHKLHMDQNEKLVMYGLAEVSACDGYSGN